MTVIKKIKIRNRVFELQDWRINAIDNQSVKDSENPITSGAVHDLVEDLTSSQESAIETINEALDTKVDKEPNKGLISNDDQEKLDGIAPGAQVNVLETISVNGRDQEPINKKVNITIPTALIDLSSDFMHRTVTDSEKDTWNAKQNALTFDSTPTAGSNNPVTSAGIKASLVEEENARNAGLYELGNRLEEEIINRDIAVSTAVSTMQVAIAAEAAERERIDATKQDIIQDLATIRSGAALGATALQEHQSLAAYVNNGVYNSEARKIELKHDNTVLFEIDATAFIKDGMVSNVAVVNGNLVISFNTDAGSEDIIVPIVDIFDADNYYNKTAADNRFLQIVNIPEAIAGLATETYVDDSIANLVDSAPEALDTLKKLSLALGGDPNFAATVSEEIGKKYTKPSTGVPRNDLASDVQNSLHKADTALQEHQPVKTLNGETLTGIGNIQLSDVATSGNYSDLFDTPINLSQFANDTKFVTAKLEEDVLVLE